MSTNIPARERIVTLSQNTTAKVSYGWRPLVTSVDDLANALHVPQVGAKDGACITQGALVGDRRMSKNVSQNDVMMLDIDNGMTLGDIVDKVQAAGLFAIVWTTYSHLTTHTEIAESKIVQHSLKMDVMLDDDTETVTRVARDYLLTVKKYDAVIAGTLEFTGRALEEGGVVFKFSHDVLPKHRILFVLETPFSFVEGGTQAERIAEWKRQYAGVSTALGLAYDSSCVDPARLMYLPRVPSQEAAKNYEISVIEGDALDPAQFVAAGAALTPAQEIAARFTNAAKSVGTVDKSRELQTEVAGLMRFVASYPDFDVLAWIENVAPDDARAGGPSGGKHWTCPNEDNHTVVSPDDTAFAVWSNDEGWGANCLHDGCTQASGKDRVWYLDKLCVKYGVKNAAELRAWSRKAVEEDREAQSVRVAASDPAALQSIIEGLSPQSSDSDLRRVLAVLGSAGDIAVARHAATVSAKLGGRPTASKIEKMAKAEAKQAQEQAQQQARAEAAEDGVALSKHPIPEDLERAGAIWLDWPANVVIDATLARLKHVNERKPFLFRRREGGIVRITHDVDGRAMAQAVTADEWAAILARHVTYHREDPLTGVVSVVPTPGHVIQILKGSDELQFPELRTINRIPLFDEDGELITARGYVPSLKIYLDPDMDFEAPPRVPTVDDVQVALMWIEEVMLDFPFCDYTDSDAPIYTEARDVDGHLKPNLMRGTASRAAFMAMMLQPHVRHLINGSTPAYHIDKPAAGTGAGFLVDAVYCVTEGTRAEIQTMSGSKEEVRKNITATLRNGRPIIFFDNVAGDLDSTDLAAMITSGVWRDRILGKSETVTIDVHSMVIIAGNNVRMSAELMRRMVPVYIDAGVSDPAQNRRPDSFKHNPLQKWTIEHRRELIWACHTLIANWFAKGKPVGTVGINSFTEWSQVMAGILEAAGVPNFLANVPAYLEQQGPDAARRLQVIAALLRSPQATREFTARQAFEEIINPVIEAHRIDTEWTERDAGKFARWFASDVVRGTIDIDADTELHNSLDAPDVHVLPTGRRVYRFTITSRKTNVGLKYRFVSTKRPENVVDLLTKDEKSGAGDGLL